jgi:diaminopimelate epimerase
MLNNLDGKYNSKWNETVRELMQQENYKFFDGVIFVENSGIADYKMNYYNKDGTGHALCGNGLRCTAKYLMDNKIIDKKNIVIEAVDKLFYCEIKSENYISVSFPPPKIIKTNFILNVNFTEWWQPLNVSFVEVGSPHIVVFINDIQKPQINTLDEINITEWGRNIRMHRDLIPEGANVNFVRIIDEKKSLLEIRSYERGVEGETLSCGTGIISSAIIANITRKIEIPVEFITRSKDVLKVNFTIEENLIKNLKLEGAVNKI